MPSHAAPRAGARLSARCIRAVTLLLISLIWRCELTMAAGYSIVCPALSIPFRECRVAALSHLPPWLSEEVEISARIAPIIPHLLRVVGSHWTQYPVARIADTRYRVHYHRVDCVLRVRLRVHTPHNLIHLLRAVPPTRVLAGVTFALKVESLLSMRRASEGERGQPSY